jgi:hypothetical protein
VAYAVEELQDLNGAFAAEADGIPVLSGFDGTVVLGQRGHHCCELIYALTVVEKIVHHLVKRALRYLFPQHLTDVILCRIDRAGEVAHPWWVEASGCD